MPRTFPHLVRLTLCAASLALLPSVATAQPQFTALAAPALTGPDCVVTSPGGVGSAVPISAEGSCNVPGPGGGTATGRADSRHGHVGARAAAAKPVGGNDVPMSASGTAVFTEQVTFTPLPGVPDPGTIPVKLNLAFMGVPAVGAFLSGADIQGSVVLGGVTIRLRMRRLNDGTSDTGSDSFDFVTLAPGLLQTPEILVPVNSPSTIQFFLEVSAGARRDGSASAEASLTFPTGIDVFVLPPGFTANAPDSFLVNDRWTDPTIPPGPPDVVIDDTTPQSVLDGLVIVPGNVVVDNTSRTTVDLGNLTSAGGVIITNNPALTSIDLTSLSTVGNVTITNNPALSDVSLDIGQSVGGSVVSIGNTSAVSADVNVGGDVGGSVVSRGNTSAVSADVNVGGDVGASVVSIGNTSAVSADVNVGGDVGGSVTITGNTGAASVELVVGSGIGGDVTFTGNTGAGSVDLVVGGGIGGDVEFRGNTSASTIDLHAGSGIGGSVAFDDNGDATVTIDTPSVGGDVTIDAGSSVSATTGDGTTAVTIANTPATMTAVLPTGSFTSGVKFSIQSLGSEPPSNGLDAGLNPVTVTPLAAYQFSFAIPTLKSDATLTFDIDVAALGAAGATAFLDALASNTATLAVRGDSPGSVFQTFAICAGELPSAGGCVSVERFDAAGAPLAPGDPTIPATVRFTGVTGHFSTFAVVLVSAADTTPPVFSNVPGDIVAEATSAAGAEVNYAMPTAVDDRDGVVGVSCAPGSAFPLGETTVTCTAQDLAGNTGSATFLVSVVDTTPPVLMCPPGQTVSATSASGAVVGYPGATVGDAVDGAPLVTYSQASGTLFPVGTTTVMVTATDASGNVSACSFTVTVTPLAASGADLSIAMTASPNPAALGSPVTYTVTLRNNGPGQATEARIVNTVVGYVRFVSASPSQGRCVGIGGLVGCDLDTLASGATATVTIVVVPRTKGNLTSTAYTWSHVTDPHLADNRAMATTLVK